MTPRSMTALRIRAMCALLVRTPQQVVARTVLLVYRDALADQGRCGARKIAPVRVRAHASLLRPIMAHLSYLSFSNNINDIVWPY